MKIKSRKPIILILILTILLTLLLFLVEYVFDDFEPIVFRNSYGEGKKTEEYEITVNGEEETTIQLEVNEQEYTHEEVQAMFKKVAKKLDEIVLGDNESWDRVETDLNLVTNLEEYPIEIQWESSAYDIVNVNGEIQQKNLKPEGIHVELRGTVSYKEDKMVYLRNAMVYPLTRKGMDKILYDIQQELQKLESQTRGSASFRLPDKIAGKTLEWSKEKQNHWRYIPIIGIVLSIYLFYRERENMKAKENIRNAELLRDYPGLISKFTMLISTGATVKNAWEKIVQNYETQKMQLGSHVVYEEMKVAMIEMQGGVPEAEVYERFGKRCGLTVYIKFGALLSQNLRKGSKGISEILRVEAIQSFENRKSMAKRQGEEAGAKLLIPMMGMLAVVFIMIMVPAFLTMQL